MDEGRSARSCLGATSDTAVGPLGGEDNGARKADSRAEASGLSESLADDSPDYVPLGTALGSITVAAWTLISRITGLLRVVVIGAVIVAFVAPQVICYTLAAVGAAVQQARGRFALASAAPALENLGMIATVVVFALWHGTGVEVLDVSLCLLLASPSRWRPRWPTASCTSPPSCGG